MFILKRKKGFTLAEVMVAMVIMGIIIFITLVSQKPFDRGVASLYQRAYRALSLAEYNAHLDLTNNAVLPIGDPQAMCYALVNVDLTKNGGNSGYMNAPTNQINCGSINNASVVPITGDAFPDTKIMFTTSNGMRFYMATDVANLGYIITVNTIPTKYCVIFVDLNGAKPPNTSVWTANNLADIVAFAVTADGYTIPIGYPEVDKRYLSVRVHYPDGATDAEQDRYSTPMTFYEAKWDSWGNVPHQDEAESFDFMSQATFATSVFWVADYAPFAHPNVHTATYACTTNVLGGAMSPCDLDLRQYL